VQAVVRDLQLLQDTAVEMRYTLLYRVGADTHITAMDSLAGRGNLFEPSEQPVTTNIFNLKFMYLKNGMFDSFR